MTERRISAYYTVEPGDTALPLVVDGVGLSQEQHPIHRDAGYEYFHFFRCLQGEGEVEAGQRRFSLKSGMGMILYPDEPHQYYAVESPWVVDWITFGGESAAAVLRYLDIGGSAAFELPRPEVTASVIDAFGEALLSQRPDTKLDISCQMYRLLASLYWNMPAGGNLSRQKRYSKLEPALRYIEEHYSEPLTLALLAEKAGVSEKHLCLLFQETLRTRPFRYINALRVNNCKRLLLERRDMSVQRVAALCGYENITYFNQVFREMAGMSPSRFRQLH